VERSTIRVLVVDDFEPFRSFVSSMLQRQEELQVIGEASDGLDAVQIARQLQPDLILLDIGLPKLNGIEAAYRIREISAQSRILFVSENRARDIAEQALRTGAAGYVVKSNAGSELLRAINTVLQGKQFVSACLEGPPRTSRGSVSSVAQQNEAIRHEVEFYASDSAFVDGFSRFIKANLRAGNVAILVATESHRTDILRRLKAEGMDVEAATQEGNYLQLDAADTLAAFMVNDMLDPLQCERVVSNLIKGTKPREKDHSRVAICGECAPTLLTQGKAEAAVRLEYLWDDITKTSHADTLCGYLWSAFPEKEHSSVFRRICTVHSAVHSR
jgi:DNA-binding NarL/FixJ family response regulator